MRRQALTGYAHEHGRRARRMRILHVVEAFGGGVFEVVTTLAERLVDSGHQVGVAYGTRPETPAAVGAHVADAIRLFDLRWQRSSMLSHLRAGRSVRRIVRDWSPDVVHLHSSIATVLGAVILPRSLPTIASPHAYSFMMSNRTPLARVGFERLERFASRRVSLVGAVSDSEADIARSVLGASAVVVVPNGISDISARNGSDALPRRSRRVVGMGRTVAQRNPAACARILGSLAEVAELQWIGGGADSTAGEAELARAGIPVTGWLEHRHALTLLASARAYLHWTSWDGQALSVLEAMAKDVVVVASDIPANRELLHPEQLCSTEAEAVAKLRRVLADDLYAHRLLARQREMRGRFSADRMVADWLVIYRRMTEGATTAEHVVEAPE